MRCHRKAKGWGYGGRTTRTAFCRKMVSAQEQPAKLRPGSGSCLQPLPALERGWCAGSSWREVFTRTCCLVAQIISVFWLLRGIWPLGFAFSFIYFCLFSILFVNTNILSHPERFLPSLKIPSSSPSTACRLVPAPASSFALCCTYLALSILLLLNSCSSGTWVPSTTLYLWFFTWSRLHCPIYFPAFEIWYEATVYPSATAALLRADWVKCFNLETGHPEPLDCLCYTAPSVLPLDKSIYLPLFLGYTLVLKSSIFKLKDALYKRCNYIVR